MFTRRQFKKIFFLSFLYSLKGCSKLGQVDFKSPPSANAELSILWERGYLVEENQGILKLVEAWQQLTGRKVSLRLASDDYIEQTLLKILKKPNDSAAPDIVFSVTFNQIIAPILAWQDQLLDLSDLIQPIESSFHTNVLSHVLYYNSALDDRSYYALPLGQSDAYIHYWKDLLTEVGYAESDIPSAWKQFWEFWKTAQLQLRSHHHPDLYGLGLCMSASGFDTSAAFQLFLDAHHVAITSQQDGLVINQPENRTRLIDVITDFTNFYREGCVPPDAMEWPGSGNNIAFLNHRILMTLNMTLSIPRTQKLEDSPYNKTAAQRYREIGTLTTYPRKLDGSLLQAPRLISQILVLKHNHRRDVALDFMQYLVKPNNMKRLIDGFKGRILPTIPAFLNDPMWQDPADPHSAAALAIYNQPRFADEDKLHPVVSQIYMQQLWAQIIRRTLQNNESPVQAADWGITQIQKIWEGFERKS